MKIAIHTARITRDEGAVRIVAADHDDLLAKVGAYCRGHWSGVSAKPPPARLGQLIDDYFAGSGESIEMSKAISDLPEPYASAPALLARLEALLAAQAAYRPGDCEAFTALCREFADARAAVAKASADLPRMVPTFTVFCQEVGGTGTIHIDTVEAADLDSAILAGRLQCLADWIGGASGEDAPFSLEDIHCLGVIEGDVRVLHWEDQT